MKRKRIGKIQSDESEESYQFHRYNLLDGEDRYKPSGGNWMDEWRGYINLQVGMDREDK